MSRHWYLYIKYQSIFAEKKKIVYLCAKVYLFGYYHNRLELFTMRRFFAFAAILIGFVACQNDTERMDVTVGDLEVKVAVTVPESRVGSDEGIFQSGLLGDSLTMRYILQIYYTDPETKTSIDPIRLVEYSDDKGVVFEVRLAPGRDYKFVAWADVVDGVDGGDKHYDTENFEQITIIDDRWNAMDETRDAYTAADSVLNFNSASTISLSLRRPNAKLRVVTTDWADDAADEVTVTYTTPHRTTFNALTGLVGDAITPITPKVHTYTLSNVYNESSDRTIFSDYFFAGDNDNVKFNMVVKKNGSVVANHQFNTEISVNSNYLTTIKGKLLTGGSSSSESQEL